MKDFTKPKFSIYKIEEIPETDATKIAPLTKTAKKGSQQNDTLYENQLIKKEKEATYKALASFYSLNKKNEKTINVETIEFVGHFLQKVWHLRKHTFDGFQLKDLKTKQYRNVGSADINRLKNLLVKEFKLKLSKAEIESFVFAETFCLKIFDPLKSYFSEVTKKYDSKAAETAFETFARLTYDRVNAEKTTFEHWRRVLRVWLAFSYAQIFDPVRVNDLALVFVSEAQGTGKTMIANALAAAATQLGLVGKPDFGDDNAKIARACSQLWIAIDGECSKRRKADVAKFKDVLSEKHFSYIEKYETQHTKKKRISSFIFCGNEVEYLTETSRREAIIPFKEDAPGEGYFTQLHEKLYQDGLTDAIWAYAYYVWKHEKDVVNKERATLNYQNTERSKAFLAPNFEDELVGAYFELPAKNSEKYDKNGDFFNILTPENAYINLKFEEIIAFLAQFTPQNTCLKPDLVRKSLQKRGFLNQQKDRFNNKIKTGYRLRIIKANRLIDL